MAEGRPADRLNDAATAERILRLMMASPEPVTFGSPDAPFSVALADVDPAAVTLLERLTDG